MRNHSAVFLSSKLLLHLSHNVFFEAVYLWSRNW
jgi:hypothetical protein